MDKQIRDKRLIEQELHRIIQRNGYNLAVLLLHFALGYERGGTKPQKESGANQ